jgi:hypothetical protein
MRQIKDAALEVVKALPAQNTAATSASIDMGAGAGKAAPNDDAALEQLLLEIEVEVTPALANGQTYTVVVKDSANNSSFATVAAIPSVVVTGAGGVGAAKTKAQFRLPPTIRRYLAFTVTASATTGDNTTKNVWMRLLS